MKEGESSPRNTVLAFTGRNKNLAGTKSQKLSHLFQSVVDFAERGQEQGSGRADGLDACCPNVSTPHGEGGKGLKKKKKKTPTLFKHWIFLPPSQSLSTPTLSG